MRAAQKLNLKKETLSELTPEELHGVAGGASISTMINPCPTRNATEPVCDFISRVIVPCLTRDC